MATMQSARAMLRSAPAFARRMAPRPTFMIPATQSRQASVYATGREIQPRRQRTTSMTPFRSPWDILDMVDPLFEGSMSHPMAEMSRQMRNVPIDVLEDASSYTIKADLPGVAKESIELEVDADTISLAVRETSETSTPGNNKKGDTSSEDTDGDAAAAGGGGDRDATVHRLERSSSFVKRTVRLPEAADMAQVSATFKDGVLALSVPKKENAVARRRMIDISSE